MPAAGRQRSTGPTGRAPHRRNEDARLAVLHAADDLVAELGFGAVTIEGIAARAGVAKQTIYRWWRSKVEILLDTLIEDAGQALAVRDTGDAIVDARRYLNAFARFLTRDPAGRVLLALIGEAQHDAEFARTLQVRYLAPRRALERELLARGVERGQLAPGLDVDAALDGLLGPIVLRGLTGSRITRRFVDGLVADTLESRRA